METLNTIGGKSKKCAGGIRPAGGSRSVEGRIGARPLDQGREWGGAIVLPGKGVERNHRAVGVHPINSPGADNSTTERCAVKKTIAGLDQRGKRIRAIHSGAKRMEGLGRETRGDQRGDEEHGIGALLIE